MHFNMKEDIIQLTRLWKGERFEDGRPKVPDSDYMPARPDLFDLVEEIRHEEGRRGTHNLWVVDNLVISIKVAYHINNSKSI